MKLPMMFMVLAAAAATVAALPANRGAAGTQPGPGATHVVGYYDTALQRVVIVGGPGQPRFADREHAWSWSGTRWERITEAGPAARSNAGAAYDARRQTAVITGGARRTANDSSWESIGDTWLGRANGWQRITGTDIAPRDHNALVYDEARGVVLMFGGIPGERGRWPTDTWALRDQSWTRIATEGPAGRARTALAYDGKRRQVVLFGGVGEEPAPRQPQPFYGDTWVFEGTSWRKAAESGPPARYAHGMVFDERAGVVLLYSGAAAHRDAPLSDMWQWDGTRWSEIVLTGPTPGFRYQPVMVYDRARGKTVLYGGSPGNADDTWEWDGRQWREIRE